MESQTSTGKPVTILPAKSKCAVVGTILHTLAEILSFFREGKTVSIKANVPSFSSQNGSITIENEAHAAKLANQGIFKVIAD